MSVTSSRVVQLEFSGDISVNLNQSALENVLSPGIDYFVTLSAGNNTVTAPVNSGFTITGLTIIPPSGNTSIITLKGVNGDTGFPLHLTDPSSIGLHSTFISLVINVVTDIIGVRLIWS